MLRAYGYGVGDAVQEIELFDTNSVDLIQAVHNRDVTKTRVVQSEYTSGSTTRGERGSGSEYEICKEGCLTFDSSLPARR